jgi:uncharacterized protein (DUF2267 family)
MTVASAHSVERSVHKTNEWQIRDADVFLLARLAEAADLPDAQQAARAAVACTHVLSKHITSGEFDDVLAQLPSEIRSVLTGS